MYDGYGFSITIQNYTYKKITKKQETPTNHIDHSYKTDYNHNLE